MPNRIKKQALLLRLCHSNTAFQLGSCLSFSVQVDVKDRKWGLKTYPQCFLGSGAADSIIQVASQLGVAVNRNTACELLQLMADAYLFVHVTKDQLHVYRDDPKVYFKYDAPAPRNVTAKKKEKKKEKKRKKKRKKKKKKKKKKEKKRKTSKLTKKKNTEKQRGKKQSADKNATSLGLFRFADPAVYSARYLKTRLRCKRIGEAKVRSEGCRAKRPIFLIPGIYSSVLEVWSSQERPRWQRERLWVDFGKVGFFSGKDTTAKTSLDENERRAKAREFVRHLMPAADGVSDPEGIRVRPREGMGGIDYLTDGFFKESSCVYGTTIKVRSVFRTKNQKKHTPPPKINPRKKPLQKKPSQKKLQKKPKNKTTQKAKKKKTKKQKKKTKTTAFSLLTVQICSEFAGCWLRCHKSPRCAIRLANRPERLGKAGRLLFAPKGKHRVLRCRNRRTRGSSWTLNGLSRNFLLFEFCWR